MNQTTENKRKRMLNLAIGISLAGFHAACQANHLRSSSRFTAFSGTALIESCLKNAIMASCIAFVGTVVLLIVVNGIKMIPSVVMVLIGNYFCLFVFDWVFHPLFSHTVESLWAPSSNIPDPMIIRSELLKLSAVNSLIGLIAGLFFSVSLAALIVNNRKIATG